MLVKYNTYYGTYERQFERSSKHQMTLHGPKDTLHNVVVNNQVTRTYDFSIFV